MKRRILALTLSIVLSASMLAGCSGKAPSGPINSGNKDDKEQTAEVQTDDQGEADGGASETDIPQNEDENDGSETEPELEPNVDPREEERILLSNSGADVAYLVDGNGNKVEEFNFDKIREYSDSYSDIFAMEYFEGFLIVKASGSRDGEWVTNILSYNVETGDVNLLSTTDTREYINFVDSYDGALYMGYYDYRGPDDTIRMRERSYFVDGDVLREKGDETEAQKLLLKNEGLYFEVNNDNSGNYGICECFTRELKENGYLLASKDRNFIKIDPDGKRTEIELATEYYKTIFGFDSEHLLFRYMDDEQEYHFIVYGINDGSIVEVPELAKAAILEYSDGRLYYYLNQSTEYGIQNNYVYYYDVASNTHTFMYETRNVPGANHTPGVTGFTLIEGEVYFVDVMDRMYKWVRVNYDESGASYTDIYCPEEEITTLKYGNVDYISNSVTCPYCGITLEKEYTEIFRLLPEYSDFYEDINNDIESQVVYVSDTEPEYTDEFCEDHLEYPDMYCTTMDKTISRVRVVDDKYLLVNYSGYWYSGGAHGMPSEEQYVYELLTGDRITLRHFYQGTEEDFKDLVEQVVTRDFENGADYISYTYNPEDLESILKDVRGCVSLDYNIFFEEDGIIVSFPPYTVGPFASGFIEVPISYQELLGRDSL